MFPSVTRTIWVRIAETYDNIALIMAKIRTFGRVFFILVKEQKNKYKNIVVLKITGHGVKHDFNLSCIIDRPISMASCLKGPTHHAYAWQIEPFSQDTLDIFP